MAAQTLILAREMTAACCAPEVMRWHKDRGAVKKVNGSQVLNFIRVVHTLTGQEVQRERLITEIHIVTHDCQLEFGEREQVESQKPAEKKAKKIGKEEKNERPVLLLYGGEVLIVRSKKAATAHVRRLWHCFCGAPFPYKDDQLPLAPTQSFGGCQTPHYTDPTAAHLLVSGCTFGLNRPQKNTSCAVYGTTLRMDPLNERFGELSVCLFHSVGSFGPP